jgi:hypothetical protein
MFYNPNIHRCEHIKANGTQCGSPSIRNKRLCFFHGRCQEQRLTLADSVASVPAGVSIAPALNMPVLEDANSVQVAIMQVMGLLLTGQVEHKTAALLLYGLQTASCNLRHSSFEAYPCDVVINPDAVDRTLMGEEVWKNSDFNVKKEDNKEKDHNAENNSLEGNPARALQEDSAQTNPGNESDALPSNWRDQVRTQIATVVKRAALQECLK